MTFTRKDMETIMINVLFIMSPPIGRKFSQPALIIARSVLCVTVKDSIGGQKKFFILRHK
jgi:hypothetical protein